jgi:hypothetical protein
MEEKKEYDKKRRANIRSTTEAILSWDGNATDKFKTASIDIDAITTKEEENEEN